ncbi:MAG: sigma-70 family RNA polymerase sigma factor [Oscillospiraceae bacterium]|nr:sigma-70 family RNA polymerase sigma factor [Oscillospiraceae bacterium]
MEQLLSVNEFVQGAAERYADMVLRIAFQHLENKEDAEDVTQEVFLRLIKNSDFHDEEHLKAWLIRVAVNLCKNHRRNAFRRRPQPVAEPWAPFSDEQQRMLDLLWTLPPHYRSVIYLYYYEGYITPEIAAILKRSEKTVWSQLSRGREKLKDLLIEGGYVDV